MSRPGASPGREIDLNADLGEGSGHDEALLDIVTSANIACGAHAGDRATIGATCAAAVERGVAIGAHPGYPDRANFGRLPLDLPAAELAATLAEQLGALATAAADAGAQPRYVKAHGALPPRAAADPAVAALLHAAAAAVPAFVPNHTLLLLGPPGTATASTASALPGDGPRVDLVVEGFADRAYTADAAGRPTLVDRRDPGALLDHDAAVAQAVSLATIGLATTPDGAPVHVHPRSICVHGDSPGAVTLAREIRDELARAGVRVRAFA